MTRVPAAAGGRAPGRAGPRLGGAVIVRDEVVAELRAALPQTEPEPGAAVRALLELMNKLPKHRGRRRKISDHVKEHLYGSKSRGRA
jgi:hypothetical protein